MKKSVKGFMLILCLCLGLTGCSAKFNPDQGISIIAREDGSGTKTAFMEIIGLKGKTDPANVVIATGTDVVMSIVKSNGQSIAYESLGYVTDEVKIIKIDNVECTVENIKAGTYKIARPLSIVHKASTIESGLNSDFYSFLMSSEAQSIINKEGYVSTNNNAPSYVKQAGLSGTIDISGSTSLKPLMTILAEKYEEHHNGVTVNVAGGGSGTGYANAENGTSHFGMISEEFVQSKAESCVYTSVAKDGIAVIVNKKNEFNNLTLNQLKNIYNVDSESKYNKWSDINA